MRGMILGLALGITFAAPALAFDQGEWVLGQWKGGEYWYPGVVENASKSRVTIRYDDGDVDTRPINQVKEYDWAVGDKVECNYRGGGTWYKGRIAALNGGSIRIDYNDGDKEKTKTGMCRSR